MVFQYLVVDVSKPARPEDDAAKIGALGATRPGGGVWLEISVAEMVFGLRIPVRSMDDFHFVGAIWVNGVSLASKDRLLGLLKG